MRQSDAGFCRLGPSRMRGRASPFILRCFSLGETPLRAQYEGPEPCDVAKRLLGNGRPGMADDAGDEFRRPVPLALAGLVVIGGALAAFLWSQDAQTRSQMTDSLNAAEKARESLAADLQNLQKVAGT